MEQRVSPFIAFKVSFKRDNIGSLHDYDVTKTGKSSGNVLPIDDMTIGFPVKTDLDSDNLFVWSNECLAFFFCNHGDDGKVSEYEDIWIEDADE